MSLSKSQLPALSLEPDWTSISLEKFSYANSSRGATKHQWIHDSRRDELYLVFRPVREALESFTGLQYKSNIRMSIYAGADVLESQDIENLVIQADLHKQRCLRGEVPFSEEAPPYVRRIQMRFRNQQDYQRAVDVYVRLNLPVENGPRPVPTASQQHMPVQMVTGNVGRQSLLSEGGLSFISSVNPVYISPGLEEHPTSSSTLSRPFSTSDIERTRPQTLSTDIMRPNSVLSMDSHLDKRTIDPLPASTSSILPQQALVRPGSSLDTMGQHSIFVSQTLKEAHLPQMISASSNEAKQHQEVCLPSGLSSTSQWLDRPGLLNKMRSISDILQQTDGLVRSTDRFLERHSIRPHSSPYFVNTTPSDNGSDLIKRSATNYDNLRPMKQALSTEQQGLKYTPAQPIRPVSAPVIESHDSLDHLIPPRRELPFPVAKPKSRPSTADLQYKSQQSASSTCASNTPLSPITDKASTPAPKRATRRVAQRKVPTKKATAQTETSTPAGHEDEVSPSAAKSVAIIQLSPTLGLQTKAAGGRKRAATPVAESHATKKQVKLMSDKATQTQPPPEREHSITSPTEANHISPLSASVNPPSRPLPADFVAQIAATVASHKPSSSPQELWTRPGYAEASPEERQSIINDFICENLENEDFLKLCEDTGEVWRRIGLER